MLEIWYWSTSSPKDTLGTVNENKEILDKDANDSGHS